MNLPNLRALLRPICDEVWPKRKIADAPVFIWGNQGEAIDRMRDYDREAFRELVYTERFLAELRTGVTPQTLALLPKQPDSPIVRLPFPAFIVWVQANERVGSNGQPFRDEFWVVVNQPNALNPDFVKFIEGDEAAYVSQAEQLPGSDATSYAHAYFKLGTNETVSDACAAEWLRGLYQFTQRTIASGQKLPSYESGQWVPLIRSEFSYHLRPFLFETFYPGNHLVTARPSAKGKSVEWVKARTHYQVMDRRSMAHVTRVGARLTAGEHAEHLKRGAHARIAHSRLLRHPCFGANVGKRIPVSSSWVGPKEWEGTDGKVYAVIDRSPVVRRSLPRLAA